VAKKPNDDLFETSTMTFGEHLEELRACLFRGVIGVAVGCVIGFMSANQVVRFFQKPLERAMERYYVDKAVGDYKLLFDEIPVEVERQILDEGLIPEPIQIDPSKLAAALRGTFPESFGGLEISQYWFTQGDFLLGGAGQLTQDLVAAKERPKTAAGRMWELLSEEEQQVIEGLAKAEGKLDRQGEEKLLAVLNSLADKRELHESKQLAGIRGPGADFTATWVTRVWEFLGYPPDEKLDPVAAVRKKLDERFDPEQSRRLNKLLIAQVFPDSLRAARQNLLSLFSWRPVKVRFQVLNAQEAFMIWMKAAIMTGLVIASPYLLFQIWVFVAAGLYPHEKNYVYLYLPISIGLFFGGASLAFVFVFDPVLNFLFTFNKGMNADFDPRIGEWLSFVLILPIGFGISFQLPLVMLFLNRIGVASLDFYIQQWRIAILIICVVSMVLTPADPISMLLMAAPLCLLYVLGILMCKYMPARRSPFAEAYEP
jgi:sec-independent protein translocase protein TatC